MMWQGWLWLIASSGVVGILLLVQRYYLPLFGVQRLYHSWRLVPLLLLLGIVVVAAADRWHPPKTYLVKQAAELADYSFAQLTAVSAGHWLSVWLLGIVLLAAAVALSQWCWRQQQRWHAVSVMQRQWLIAAAPQRAQWLQHVAISVSEQPTSPNCMAQCDRDWWLTPNFSNCPSRRLHTSSTMKQRTISATIIWLRCWAFRCCCCFGLTRCFGWVIGHFVTAKSWPVMSG